MTPTQPNSQAPGIMDVSRQQLTKQQILKPEGEYSKALNSLIQTHVRAESDREQSQVYAKIRRNNLYYRGFQYLTMVRNNDGTMDYKPLSGGGMAPTTGNQDRQDEMYDNILPLFRGDVRKWCGVLGVRAPNAKCSPRTVGDDHQVRLSRIGDRAISYLRNTWKSDEMQRYLAYSLAVNGTTFGYVNYVADGNKLGYTSIPKMEVVQVPAGESYFECGRCGTETPVMQVQQTGRCAQCEAELGPEDFREPDMVPSVVQTGVQRYPNGAVQMQFATGATVKTPYYITSDMEHCPWVWWEYLVNRYELIHTYAPSPAQDDRSPDAQFRRELREHLMQDRTSDTSGGASTAEVRRTINTQSSPSGQPYERKALGALSQYFLSPGQMEGMTSDESGNIREQMLSRYPKGVHLIYVCGKLADVRGASIAAHWSVCQPDTGDFIYRDAVFDDYIQGVDVINDCLNLLIQQAEKSTPLTFFDPDVVDPDYLRDANVRTGEFLAAKKGVGSQLAQSFFRTPVADFNTALQSFIEFYIQKNRENVGIMPAIYGGGDADEAVGVAKIRRNQSLMQLNIPWNYMRDFWSQTYYNAMQLLAQYSNGKLYANRGGVIETEELDGIWELAQGGIKVECEESMPMTWAQRQEQVESMLARPPQAWSVLGLTDPSGQANPDNVEVLQDAVGLPDWKVPGLAARERLLDIVQQLIQSDPIDQPPDPMTGQPGPPTPSIQPNTTMFDPPFAVPVLRDWLVGDKGREAEQGGLPGQSKRGFENVLAYTQAWMQLAAPPPPPEGPGGPGGGPPPEANAPPPVDQRGVVGPPPGPPGLAAPGPPPGGMSPTPPPGMVQ